MGRRWLTLFGKYNPIVFWEALYDNFLYKGYPQFLKFVLSKIAIDINQLLFANNIAYLPSIVAFISYLFYASIFCLPILLFSFIIKQ